MSSKKPWDEKSPMVREMLRRPYLTREEIMGIFTEEDQLVAVADGMLREYESYHTAVGATPSADGDPEPSDAPHVQRREGVFRFTERVREQLLAEVRRSATPRIEVVDAAHYQTELVRILHGRSADAFLEARRPIGSAHDLLFRAANGNIRFIARQAGLRARRHPGVEFSDLLHEGLLGCVRAGKRFNQFSGASYLGYAAFWIRQRMLQYISDQSRTIRVPAYRWRQLDSILRESNRLWHEKGTVPLEELAERIRLKPSEITDCVEAFSMHASLQGGFFFLEEGDDRTLEGVLASEGPTPEDEALDRIFVEQLREEVSHLPDRERHIITRYFGLDGRPSETLQQISMQFGCTKENIRLIKEKALARLRLTLPFTGEDAPY